MPDFKIYISNKDFLTYSNIICDYIEASAKERGTGIAKRPEEYIRRKIENASAKKRKNESEARSNRPCQWRRLERY